MISDSTFKCLQHGRLAGSETNSHRLMTAFLQSCLHTQGTDQIEDWLRGCSVGREVRVRRIALHSMAEWVTDPRDGFRHASGKFFSIRGVRATARSGNRSWEWEQPIIDQPEIGLLGFLAKMEAGKLWLLAQSKDEPGNVLGAQLSPTVQATESNFMRVHGGKAVPYVSYFRDPAAGSSIVAQLQPEHGTYFLGKRNLNAVLLAGDVPLVNECFRWVTVGQLLGMLKHGFRVSMDTRAVLSCLVQHMANQGPRPAAAVPFKPTKGFGLAVWKSLFDDGGTAPNEHWVLDRLKERNVTMRLDAKPVAMNEMEGWEWTDDTFRSQASHVSVEAFTVDAPMRERESWSQPLLRQHARGIIGFACQMINGTLHFLGRASLEPGEADRVRIAPTVVWRGAPELQNVFDDTLLLEYFAAPVPRDGVEVRMSVEHSEEGGRFFRFVHLHLIIEFPESRAFEAPPGFVWLTLAHLYRFAARQELTIESRNLLAGLGIGVGEW
jgi:dTDP-4-dehydro-6-deoxy-alpha-D-glucopyranose 2,3-dehydratase